MNGLRRIPHALRLTWAAGRGLTALAVVLTLSYAAVPLATAWLTLAFLNRVVRGGAAQSSILAVALGLAGVGLLAGLAPHVVQYAQRESERRVGLLAQDRLFAVTERFVGLARFEDPAFLDRMRLALQSGGATPGAVVTGTLSVVGSAFTAVGFLGSMFYLSAWMPILVLASGGVALAAELWLAKRRAHMFWRIGPIQRREIFYRGLLTDVRAAKEIRIFGTGSHLRERMRTERGTANAAQNTLDRREVLLQSGAGATTALTAGGALIWAAYAAAAGRITPGEVTLLIAAITGVQTAMVAIARETARTHQQLLLFRHYTDVMACAPDLPVAAAPLPVGELRSGIEFRDVWFRYSSEHPWALRGLNLTIPAGRALAVVGRNGAGKSTLIKLLCRMYDPDQGQILWDGVDLRDLDPVALRTRIGAVFQDYMEYELTALDNIAMGDLTRADRTDRIEAAARKSGAHDFVAALPRGYDTLLSRTFADPRGVGEAGVGVTLSGGQWQRLALARAYLRADCDLLILDEPSSGLDAEAEARIHVDLRRYRRGRTSLLISHRLGAVREADELVVLDDGRIAQRGTHHELMAAGGLYERLFSLQAAGYREPTGEAA
ncbi:ABC transporter ATP-binding protein [Embleya hyalina]|uniref:Multidrug ABC transporter permease n=1 Tax=Embleya hyalina TaxID=516124 RepID=A0A401YN75_9ACTN|nr:ABC transporter ATP-binding protein [Embleya hyalina]GCD96041.1 multidrug ABC transporter permease [Embleya hyalina]